MEKKYFILAFTFLCMLLTQNSFGQLNNGDDYDDEDPCEPKGFNYDPNADCGGGACDPLSSDYDPEQCNSGGGDPCDPASSAYDPFLCSSGGSGDPCDPASSAYDPFLCSSGGSGDPCDPSSSAYDPWECNSGGGSGDPCDPSSSAYDPWECNSGGGSGGSGSGDPCNPLSNAYDPWLCNYGGDVCDITSNSYDPIACAINSGDPCDPFSNNYDPYAPECNTPPDSGDVCDETSASYDYIACNYPGGTGGGSNGGSGGGSGGSGDGSGGSDGGSGGSGDSNTCRCITVAGMYDYLQRNLSLDSDDVSWLNSDINRIAYIYNYLAENNNNSTAITAMNNMIDYLKLNPNVTIAQYENWFLVKSEGIDSDYNAAFWDNPTLSFPQQNLPTYNDFLNGMPRFADGSFMKGADNVYGLVGGDVLGIRNAYRSQTENTCALKVSIALNSAGVVIPNVPGTFEGAGQFAGKYFFLNAKTLNAWMRKTFGTSPANTSHFSYTSADGGPNGIDFPDKLKNKNGIYSMITTEDYVTNQNGASGHADLLFPSSVNGKGTCIFGCSFNLPIERIDVWILN